MPLWLPGVAISRLDPAEHAPQVGPRVCEEVGGWKGAETLEQPSCCWTPVTMHLAAPGRHGNTTAAATVYPEFQLTLFKYAESSDVCS